TAGFADLLEIRRERRYDLYDNFLELLPPLVPRQWRLEVAERIAPDGSVVTPLDEAELRATAATLRSQGVESVAVGFLHSFRNSAHEDRAAQILRDEFPELAVSTSAEVVAEIREYERLSTTVANAYVKPLADRYITLLEQRLREIGIEAPLFLMQSNGGLVHTREAKRLPVQLLESGPAAGALVAAYYGRQSGDPKILAFDMGGTTAKLSVVDDGEPLVAYTFEAARQKRFRPGSGLPIKISTIELIEIGAGGGSIAHVDRLGLLKVGPESASSQPGPACYQRGGELPTVTDANLLLGYLNAATFAGGTMRISPDAAETALTPVARALKLETIATAAGIVDVVNENMAAAARVHIAERGKDARDYSLLVTGGGGPLHGYSVARALGLRRLMCPPAAGVASALGLLIAPPKVTRVRTVSLRLGSADMARLESEYRELEADAIRTLQESGVRHESLRIRRFADMRYVGQGFELVAELPAGPYDDASRSKLLAAFESAYRAVFTVKPPVQDAEIVNMRISAEALDDESVEVGGAGFEAAQAGPRAQRRAFCPDLREVVEMPVVQRDQLRAGTRAEGPVIIEEPASTLIVGSRGSYEVLPSGVIVVNIGSKEQA
ncbi:MAG: hydantoinase/oxoprolinase family protein, partial [Burkholderiaceae bacterium]